MVFARVDFPLPFSDEIKERADAISLDLAAGTITEDEAAKLMEALTEEAGVNVQIIEKGQLSLF
jgi:hypothetical protein